MLARILRKLERSQGIPCLNFGRHPERSVTSLTSSRNTKELLALIYVTIAYLNAFLLKNMGLVALYKGIFRI